MTPREIEAALRRAHDAEMKVGALRFRSFVYGCVTTTVVMLCLFLSVLVYAQSIPREAAEHRRELVRASRAVWGMDAPIATFAAQVHQESRWRAEARSGAGAQGLTQFMPATARWIATAYPSDLNPPAPFDPAWSLRAMVRYNRFLFERVAAIDECERAAFMLAAYNGGLGWVNRRKAKSDMPLICLGATCDINPGVTWANQRENSEYSRRILLATEPIYVAAGWGRGVCG